MINKSELMLGNLIKDDASGEWMEVDNVGPELSANILNKNLDPMPDTVYMVPIPITRAGLMHIGFAMEEAEGGGGSFGSEVWSKEGRVVFFVPGDGVVLHKFRQNADRSHEGVVLQYIHQVQNLYTVLTYPNALAGAQWRKILDTPLQRRAETFPTPPVYRNDPPPMERADKDPKKSYKYHLLATINGLYDILPLIMLTAFPPLGMAIVTGNKLWLISVLISLPAGIAFGEYLDANKPSK